MDQNKEAAKADILSRECFPRTMAWGSYDMRSEAFSMSCRVVRAEMDITLNDGRVIQVGLSTPCRYTDVNNDGNWVPFHFMIEKSGFGFKELKGQIANGILEIAGAGNARD